MRKILIITFCLMLIAQSLGKYSDYHYYCNQNEQIDLSVFNANIWGLTYFDDEPIPSSEEGYDMYSVRQSTMEVSKILDYSDVPNKHVVPNKLAVTK